MTRTLWLGLAKCQSETALVAVGTPRVGMEREAVGAASLIKNLLCMELAFPMIGPLSLPCGHI